MIMGFFKRLFCDHKFKLVHFYVPTTNVTSGTYFIKRCNSCGKVKKVYEPYSLSKEEVKHLIGEND